MRGAFQQNSASGSVTDRRASLSGWCISCREIEGVRMGGWCVKVRCGEDGKEAYLNGTGVVGRDISGQVPSTVCSPLHLYRLPNSQYLPTCTCSTPSCNQSALQLPLHWRPSQSGNSSAGRNVRVLALFLPHSSSIPDRKHQNIRQRGISLTG